MGITTSVVICAYTEDRWDQLAAAVASVRAQVRPVEELVIVIDHNETLYERALDRLPSADIGPATWVVRNRHGRGLSGARNTGIETSSGEIVLFLDDDAYADRSWTTYLMAPFANDRVLGVGGSADPAWETPAPRWWPREFDWVVGCSYRGQPTTLAPVRNLMGCNMSLRRSVLDAVGGFDSSLGRSADNQQGCEETEFCIQAQRHFPDGVLLHEPRAVVHHHVPGTRASWRYFRDRCRAEGVSKARVARTVGRSAALSTETCYVRRVLPSGVVNNLRSGLSGDLSGLGRAAAIVAGLGLTATSFLVARWSPGARRADTDYRAATQSVPPVLPMVVDLDQPLPAIDPRRSDAEPYAAALCVVTEHGKPVGRVRLELDGAPLTPEQVEVRLRDGLHSYLASSPPTRGGPCAITDPNIDATVVIATRERPDRLAECLESVLAGTLLPRQIVVVDNAPTTERTSELVTRLASEKPLLRYVREVRPGLARAHNAALPHVQTPVVAFTDDDVLVDVRWLERLVNGFIDPDVACITGMIAPRELGTLPQQWVEGNLIYDKGLHRQVFDTGPHRPQDPLFPLTAGVFGSGANMAFRTAYLRGRHGFDPALGTGTVAMGGDDLASFYDVITDGWRLVYEPAAIVVHQHHRDYPALRRQTYGYGAGLGAHLTRSVLADPRQAGALVRHAMTAGRRARRIVQPPLVAGLPPYPKDLSRQQLLGLVSGPARYLRSRRHAKREVA